MTLDGIVRVLASIGRYLAGIQQAFSKHSAGIQQVFSRHLAGIWQALAGSAAAWAFVPHLTAQKTRLTSAPFSRA